MANTSGEDPFANFLDPEVTRTRLVTLSVYLAAYESLERSITENLRIYYSSSFSQGVWKTSDEYKTEVLSRNKSIKHASLDWLRDNEVLSEADLIAFNQVKNCRNEIAHKMWELVSECRYPKHFFECFEQLTALVRKIEVWWIVNVEVAINPDFIEQDIDENQITPGPCMMLDMLRRVALDPLEESRVFFDEYINRTSTTSADSVSID